MISICRDASSFMREVICYNQGDYIQYNFLAGESHKTLKDASRESPPNVQKLRELCVQLEEFLNKRLYGVSLQNFRFIKAYFRGRDSKEPRICIKGHHKEGATDHVVQLIRDKKVSYLSDYPLKDNSGFLFVKNHGRYFKCDDIPKSIVTDGYHNARIDTNLACAYYEQTNVASARPNDNHASQFDTSWVKCWKSPQSGSDPIDPASCYKSTVIIPMTLWNNKLAQSFLKRLGEKQEEDIDTKARTIFGYLCFDHVEKNYFNNDVDIDIGYIFADIISLYMITRIMYTELSTTHSKVRQLLTRCDNEHYNSQH